MTVEVSRQLQHQDRHDGTNGVASVGNVPLGQTATVLAYYPGTGSGVVHASVSVTTASGPSVPLQLPAFGTVTVDVRQPKNNAVGGAGVSVRLNRQSGAGGYFSFSGTTGEDSRITFAPVPVGATFTIVTPHPSTRIDGSFPTLDADGPRGDGDGQAPLVATHYPAVARMVVTVLSGPNPVQNAEVQRVANPGVYPYGTVLGTTNASGIVDVAQIAEGTHALRVLKPGLSNFNPAVADVLEMADATIARTDDGGTVNVPISVSSFTGVIVTGQVVEADASTPMKVIYVQLLRAVDLQPLASTYTGDGVSAPAGSFRFDSRYENGSLVPLTGTGAGFLVRASGPIRRPHGEPGGDPRREQRHRGADAADAAVLHGDVARHGVRVRRLHPGSRGHAVPAHQAGPQLVRDQPGARRHLPIPAPGVPG